MFTEQDQHWLQHAMRLAEQAALQDEVPVGAVLVHHDQIIGEGFNRPIAECDSTAHAEVLAIREGAKTLNNYRLVNTTLYVTLEPCIMCVGAITHARLARVVFGAFDPKGGAVTSAFQLGEAVQLNHRVQYQGGLLADPCGKMLTTFFKSRR